MRAFLVALLASSALLFMPSASAKDFGPGDLRVCNAKRCVAIVNRQVLPQLGSFYYSGRPWSSSTHRRSARRTTSCASGTTT